jgi:hypothetical protein
VVVAHFVPSGLVLNSNFQLNCQQPEIQLLGSLPVKIHLFGQEKKQNYNLVFILGTIIILILILFHDIFCWTNIISTLLLLGIRSLNE